MANERRRIGLLFAVLTMVAVVIGATAVTLLYRTAFAQQRERLIETARTQAKLVEAIASNELAEARPSEAEAGVLRQLRAAQNRYVRLKHEAQISIARREGEQMVFLLDLTPPDEPRRSLPIGGELAQPMQHALAGESGWMVARDGFGQWCLAAYEPVGTLGWGLTARVSLAAIRAPFIRAAGYTAAAAAVVIGLGALVFIRVTRPMLRQLRESEQQLRRAVIDAPFPVIIHREDGGIVMTSRVLNEITGYKPEEIRTISQWAHLAYRERAQSALSAMQKLYTADGRVAEGEYEVLTAGGTVRVWDFSAAPLGEDASGVRRVISMAMDVTERKRAAAARLAQRERFRMFYEESPVPYQLMDSSGQIEDVNQAFLDAMGYQHKSEVLARPWSDFLEEGSRQRLKAHFESHEAAGRARQLDFTALRKDGSHIHIMVDWKMGPSPDGSQQQIHCVWSDISDRRHAEIALKEAKAAAEAANEAKDRLLSTVSHELRAPLTPVLVKLSALQENPQSPHWLHSDLALMRRSVELEARLIDGLLDLTRMTQSKVRLKPERVDAHELLDRALAMAADDVGANRPTIQRQYEARESSLYLDPTRLQQVYWNIIRNALQYTPHTGGLTIRTRNTPAGMLETEFSDDGPGIDPEFMPRVFRPFERGQHPGQRRSSGLGLGLAIAKSLTEQLGGTISAASEGCGKGATFTVQVPVVANEPRQDRPAEPAPRQTRPLSILLVEDDEATLEALTGVLKVMGHQVDTATNVQEAIAAGRRQKYELLISDIGLPDGSGLDVLKWFLKHQPIPCMALSGYGTEKDIERSRDAGFEMHIVKPVSLATLRWAIAEVTQKPAPRKSALPATCQQPA